MKFLFDYFPILCFFIAYKIYGIYAATAVTMAAIFLQVIIQWVLKRRVEKIQWISLIVISVLGTATLTLHNPLFIKWKPSVVYWIFSIALLVSHFFGEKPLMARFLDKQIELPKNLWVHINVAWAIFFLLLGFVNLYVAYYYDTATWVNFKLFGTLGAILLFGLLQGFYIYKKTQVLEV